MLFLCNFKSTRANFGVTHVLLYGRLGVFRNVFTCVERWATNTYCVWWRSCWCCPSSDRVWRLRRKPSHNWCAFEVCFASVCLIGVFAGMPARFLPYRMLLVKTSSVCKGPLRSMSCEIQEVYHRVKHTLIVKVLTICASGVSKNWSVQAHKMSV